MTLEEAIELIRSNAELHREKQPALRTLLAEIAELAYALDGDHEHPPELELVEVGGIVANMLKGYSLVETQQAVVEREAER